MAHAKIVGGVIVKTTQATPKGIATGPDGNPVWRPIVVQAQPAFDPLTQTVAATETIEPTQIVKGWSVKDKTAQEIDADKTAAVNGVNGMYSPLIKILRNHENRLRIVENSVLGTSKPPLSLDEVKVAIKAIL